MRMLLLLALAQIIKSKKGYSPQIGATVAMLEDLRDRVTRSVEQLTIAQTDILLHDKANRIGALIFSFGSN